MRQLSRAALLSALITLAAPGAHAANPPAQITRASYLSWLRGAGSNVSAFTDVMFAWYDEQLRNPLPSQVNADPEKIYVAVDRALRETIALEDAGDIEQGNTIGFEAYAILDVPVNVALETKLFNWGKPVGQRVGETRPFDTVFSNVRMRIDEKWGAGNYYSITNQSGGGFVQSLNDDYSILVRGNATDGYTVYNGYFAPNASTATLAHVSIVTLRPLPGGKTEYRQNVRQNGQSYLAFGLEYGRRNFGFNAVRVRQGVKWLRDQMLELKTTGKIRENSPPSPLY